MEGAVREFDSAAWTGRRPSFPKLRLNVLNRFFTLAIGPDWGCDAYTVRFSAIPNPSRQDGEYFFKVNKVWWLVTRHQVASGYF